jgi:putative ABC transport system permease protein
VIRPYRLLLHALPASFRREYGGEMQAIFAARLKHARGRQARSVLCFRAVTDVLTTAACLHADLALQDVRYAARTLARTPGFTVTAVLVTALGIGANTAVFSVADLVLLRPLPYRASHALVTVWQRPPGYRLEVSAPNYRDWKAMTRSFQSMGAYHWLEVNLLAATEPERVTGSAVTSDVLPLLGVKPAIGRLFTAQEESEGSTNRLILSDGLWHRLYGGDARVLGRTVRLDGIPHTIVGVMPRSFSFPNREVAFWTLMPAADRLNDERDNYSFYVVARLADGISIEQARADVQTAAARLERAYPAENAKMSADVFALRDEYSAKARTMLVALCAASAAVLLIACANLAGLLVARALGRRRELEVRTALGASRERLVRQLVTESVLLAGAGGLLALAIALAVVPALTRLVPLTLPTPDTPSIDLRTLGVAAALTLVTAMIVGLVPALRSSATTDFSALREGARGGGLRGMRVRSGLVLVEVMASIVLLVWTGLLLRALHRIDSTDSGFRAEGVLTLRTALPRPKYDLAVKRQQFYDAVLGEVRRLPGVRSAAYISFVPMTFGGGIFPVGVSGQPASLQTGRVASMRFATPEFFAAMGIPLRRGRDIRETDTASQPLVAVVSESFARQYLPDGDPLGQRFEFAYAERTVVGVVGDVRVRGPERGSEPQVYLPYKQVDDRSFPFFTPKDLVVRSTLPPDALVPELRRIVRASDPDQAIADIRPLSAIVARQTEPRRVQLLVLGAFATVALLLAGVGIHGLLAFTVSQRRHEIGVRMALGAAPRRIVREIVRQSTAVALGGVLPGLALAYAGGRAMEALLAGVTPGDGATLAGAAALCVAIALVGTIVPAARAVRVEPAKVFRAE